jgi:hypothetical protein
MLTAVPITRHAEVLMCIVSRREGSKSEGSGQQKCLGGVLDRGMVVWMDKARDIEMNSC